MAAAAAILFPLRTDCLHGQLQMNAARCKNDIFMEGCARIFPPLFREIVINYIKSHSFDVLISKGPDVNSFNYTSKDIVPRYLIYMAFFAPNSIEIMYFYNVRINCDESYFSFNRPIYYFIEILGSSDYCYRESI